MAEVVIKRDGSTEPFDDGKIRRSIEAAARSTDLSEERIAEIVEDAAGVALSLAAGKEKISTEEIRKTILERLDEIEPSVSEAWREFDEERGRA